jgi:hypothetical protein
VDLRYFFRRFTGRGAPITFALEDAWPHFKKSNTSFDCSKACICNAVSITAYIKFQGSKLSKILFEVYDFSHFSSST